MTCFAGNSFDEKVSSLAQVCFSKMLSCVNEKSCNVLISELVSLIEEATHRISRDDNAGEFVLKSPQVLDDVEGKKFSEFNDSKICISFFFWLRNKRLAETGRIWFHWKLELSCCFSTLESASSAAALAPSAHRVARFHQLLLIFCISKKIIMWIFWILKRFFLNSWFNKNAELSSSIECVRLIGEIFPIVQKQLCSLVDLVRFFLNFCILCLLGCLFLQLLLIFGLKKFCV